MESVTLKVADVPKILRCFCFSPPPVLTIRKKIVSVSNWLLKLFSSCHNLLPFSESVSEKDLSESQPF